MLSHRLLRVTHWLAPACVAYWCVQPCAAQSAGEGTPTETPDDDSATPGDDGDSVAADADTSRTATSDAESDGSAPSADPSATADDTPADPALRATPEVPEPREVAVQFVAPEPGLRIFIHWGGTPHAGYVEGPWQERLEAQEFEPLCTAPCTRPLEMGMYSVALAEPDGTPVRAEQPLLVDRPSVVRGDYQSNQLWRTLGWVTMGVSVLAGTGLVIAAFGDCDTGDGQCVRDNALIWAGTGVVFGGITGGLLLTLTDDTAEIRVEPAR